jgi:hypothetical protein
MLKQVELAIIRGTNCVAHPKIHQRRVELPKAIKRKVTFGRLPERKKHHLRETEVVQIITKHQKS